MQAFERLRQLLVVPGQASKPRHPTLTTLHNLAPRQQHKATPGLRALDDFEFHVVGFGILSRLLTRVGLVDKRQFDRIACGLLHLFGQFGHLMPLLLIAAARRVGRHGHRDATMLLLAYRHGLRVSELVALRWEQVDLQGGVLHVRRRKNGLASTHPLYGPEIRALRVLARAYPETPYVFVSERKGPLAAATVRKIVARAGEAAHLGFPVHPHMFRHATGFKLANEGHDTRVIQHYLGHKNIQHTVGYTVLAAACFQGLWPD